MTNWANRARNREELTKVLKENNIYFESFNFGAHLKIGTIDFWPGTGLWKSKTNEGRGVHELLEYLKTFSSDESQKPIINTPELRLKKVLYEQP